MSQDNNFLDEFNSIVSNYYMTESNNVNTTKRSRILKSLLTGIIFLSGLLLLIILSVVFVFIFLAIVGFAVMLWSSLQIWKMFTNSTYFDKIATRYNLYRMYLRELDNRRFGPPPKGRNRRVEDEFWSF